MKKIISFGNSELILGLDEEHWDPNKCYNAENISIDMKLVCGKRLIEVKDTKVKELEKFIDHVQEIINISLDETRRKITMFIFECPECASKISIIQKDRNAQEPDFCVCGRRNGFRLVNKKIIPYNEYEKKHDEMVNGELGKFDVDKLEGSASASQRSKINKILDILRILEKNLGKPVPKEEILAAAEDEAIGAATAEETLRKLKREGLIFEPKIGFYKRLEYP